MASRRAPRFLPLSASNSSTFAAWPMSSRKTAADRWRVRQFARERKTMTTNFEETLISVWHQALVEDCKKVTLEGVHYAVRPTSRSKLREVDFRFEEQTLRGLEQ